MTLRTMTLARLGVWTWTIAVGLGVATGARAQTTGNGPGHPAPVVETTEGLVRGSIEGNRITWLGIPYAAPPVGSRRWQPPAPPATHQGMLHATETRSACPQDPGPFGVG